MERPVTCAFCTQGSLCFLRGERCPETLGQVRKLVSWPFLPVPTGRDTRKGYKKIIPAQSPSMPTDEQTDSSTCNSSGTNYSSTHARKLRLVGCRPPSPSPSSLVDMKVVVQAEASFTAYAFCFKMLISLSTRLL